MLLGGANSNQKIVIGRHYDTNTDELYYYNIRNRFTE